MGWSESYYSDIEREAARELQGLSQPLVGMLLRLREVLEVYGEFVREADDLEVLLERLQDILGCYS